MDDPSAPTLAAGILPGLPDDVPGRLAWRCRRGMKELDLVLVRYLRTRWTQADAHDKVTFERILELPDPQLAAYLMGRESVPDPDFARVIRLLRQD